MLAEQARPVRQAAETIIEKMVEGRLRKYLRGVGAARAGLRASTARPVAKVVEDAAKEVGAPVKLAGFVRFALGEGIEKKQDDFAAEVAAQLKK